MAKEDTYIDEAYEMLKHMSADEKKRLEYEAKEKAIRDYNSQMLELKEVGRKEGRKEGIKEGIKEGKDESRKECIEKLLNTFTRNQIVQALEVSPELVNEIADKRKQQINV